MALDGHRATSARSRRRRRSISSSAAGMPPLARGDPGVDRVETLDAALAGARGRGPRAAGARCARRGAGGRAATISRSTSSPTSAATSLAAAAGAARTAGWASGGGGPLLDVALDYDPRRTRPTTRAGWCSASSAGRRRSSARPAPRRSRTTATRGGRGSLRPGARTAARRRPRQRRARDQAVGSGTVRARSAAPARRRTRRDDRAHRRPRRSAARRPACRRALAPRLRDRCRGGRRTCSRSAALLARLDLLVTGDTGPMHLAAAVGTPVVAVFGPSDPARYAPRGPRDRVVRIDLPCSPCNRIRRPPARCVGHTPTASPASASTRCSPPRSRSSTASARRAARARPSMTDAVFAVERGAGRRERPPRRRTSMRRPRNARPTTRIAWIKSLRHARVDGVPLRRRFTFRGDSLWWFAELYLHKQQVVARHLFAHARGARRARRARAAARRCGVVDAAAASCRALAPQVAAARERPRTTARADSGAVGAARWRAMDARAAGADRCGARVAAALARVARRHAARRRSLAFVHRAFWRRGRRRRQRRGLHRPGARPRSSAGCGRASVALRRRRAGVEFPRAPLVASAAAARPAPGAVAPIERYAPLGALRGSRAVWRERHAMRRALWDERRPARARGDPRLRLLAARPRGARRASRCCSGRGRRARWTKRPPRSTRCRRASSSPTRKPAAGAARSCSKPAARHPVGRPAARLHLPPLAELPARAGRDGGRRRAARGPRLPAARR